MKNPLFFSKINVEAYPCLKNITCKTVNSDNLNVGIIRIHLHHFYDINTQYQRQYSYLLLIHIFLDWYDQLQKHKRASRFHLFNEKQRQFYHRDTKGLHIRVH